MKINYILILLIILSLVSLFSKQTYEDQKSTKYLVLFLIEIEKNILKFLKKKLFHTLEII